VDDATPQLGADGGRDTDRLAGRHRLDQNGPPLRGRLRRHDSGDARTVGEGVGDHRRQAADRTAPAVQVGGAAAENHDLEKALAAVTPLVLGIVLGLGFLLLVTLQAPLAAALGVVTNLLAVGAAFGVGRLIFQDGHGAGFLGFTSQGYVDAWAPVFFFAMIFAISMDYTVFLLSSAKEHWERSHDAHDAMVGGVAHSGRVIFAAAAVMVAVFFTFAISGPLPPKEMGVVLGVAVLLDALLLRLLLLPVLLRLAGRAGWASPA
jgi:RND superfamily putative drug exporter